jgi:hypothetical protein
MKIDNIDIAATVKKARDLLEEEKELSAVTKSIFAILILIILNTKPRYLKMRLLECIIYIEKQLLQTNPSVIHNKIILMQIKDMNI